MAFNWKEIEAKWQKVWADSKLFEVDPDSTRPKCLVTFPFAYMSGPLHVGSGFTSGRIDAYARFMRMRGYNTLYPWAWHWTGKPLHGAAERVKMGDEAYIRGLRDIDGVPEDVLKNFVDPAFMARYYTKDNRETVKRFGLSIDWRREFHTSSLNPQFSKFVEWQYLRLRELGYLAQGTHPVVWCPKDESPTGDHDRLEGEGVRPEQYVLVKFKLDGLVLPCATFRPETIYGVTNIWVNPDAEYVEADVDGEHWIISQPCTEKLKQQAKTVKIVRRVKGDELIGKTSADPVMHRKLPVLPGWFVNPENATGLVYSVPAHAPVDWLALRDLQRDPSMLKKFGMSEAEVKKLKPISMIAVEGFGDFPAVEIVDRLGVKDQKDPKAEEATKEIYKREFHSGVLKPNCGEYSGFRVSEVKQKLVSDFTRRGIVDHMYELPQLVTCRCTTRCVVKILEDQWFLHYSDEAWKNKAREAISKISFYPEVAKNWFENVVDWLQDWACARKTGLGTPLPWQPDWIVETLSDSTIYMAYYMVSKYVNTLGIKPESLTPEVFDSIYYGKGERGQIAKRSGLSEDLLTAIRQDFLYWYPVDLRNSGKDLVGNHLTFFIFHHTALFPPEHWPRSIGVNGYLLSEGQPMHKSRGNFVPLRAAIEEYGADPTRCALLLGAEGMDDPDWRVENVREVKNRLEALHRLAGEVYELHSLSANGHLERWLRGRIMGRVKATTAALESLRTRTALAQVLYEVWNDVRWYQRRTDQPDGVTLNDVLSIWVRMLAPFAPHLCEEIWANTGHGDRVATAPWPTFDETKVDHSAEEMEEFVKRTLEDTLGILRATSITPKKVYYYVAADWKWKAYQTAQQLQDPVKQRDMLLKQIMKDAEMRSKGQRAQKFVETISKELSGLSNESKQRRASTGKLDEFNLIKSTAAFLSRELKAEVTILREEEGPYDPKGRANLAQPYRPAIYVEN